MNRRRYLCLLALIAFLCGCDAASSSAPLTASRATRRLPTAAKGIEACAWRTDFAAAHAEAQRDAKPLLLLFTADWCSYCDEMQNELASQRSFVDAAKHFVCVEIDGEHCPELVAEYRVKAYPTLVLASPHGAALQRLVGVQAPASVVAQMNATVTVVAGRAPPAAAISR